MERKISMWSVWFCLASISLREKMEILRLGKKCSSSPMCCMVFIQINDQIELNQRVSGYKCDGICWLICWLFHTSMSTRSMAHTPHKSISMLFRSSATKDKAFELYNTIIWGKYQQQKNTPKTHNDNLHIKWNKMNRMISAQFAHCPPPHLILSPSPHPSFYRSKCAILLHIFTYAFG